MAKKFLAPIDMNKLEILNLRFQQLASAPGSPVTGQTYYDTAVNKWFYWNGTGWIDPLARANHTGSQTAATISDFDTQVRTSTLNQMAAPTASVSMNSQKITNLLDPTGAQDAATKAYVDAAAVGIDWKPSVRAATTANIANLAGGAPNTLDGVTLVANDRVLVKDQSTGSQNGIYVVTTLGTGANGSWTRATDADANAEVTPGLAVFVEEGSTQADTGWVLTTNAPITVGSTALVFTQFTGIGSILAGAGLTKTGNTIDVIAGNASIVVAADEIHVGFSGVTPATITAGGAGAVGTDVTPAHADHNHPIAGFMTRFSASVGDGSTTSIVVTHSLGTKDVLVQLFDNTTPFSELEVEVQHTSTTTITLVFAVAPTTNQYRVVVIG